jgi:hypothetical protein
MVLLVWGVLSGMTKAWLWVINVVHVRFRLVLYWQKQ